MGKISKDFDSSGDQPLEGLPPLHPHLSTRIGRLNDPKGRIKPQRNRLTLIQDHRRVPKSANAAMLALPNLPFAGITAHFEGLPDVPLAAAHIQNNALPKLPPRVLQLPDLPTAILGIRNVAPSKWPLASSDSLVAKLPFLPDSVSSTRYKEQPESVSVSLHTVDAKLPTLPLAALSSLRIELAELPAALSSAQYSNLPDLPPERSGAPDKKLPDLPSGAINRQIVGSLNLSEAAAATPIVQPQLLLEFTGASASSPAILVDTEIADSSAGVQAMPTAADAAVASSAPALTKKYLVDEAYQVLVASMRKYDRPSAERLISTCCDPIAKAVLETAYREVFLPVVQKLDLA